MIHVFFSLQVVTLKIGDLGHFFTAVIRNDMDLNCTTCSLCCQLTLLHSGKFKATVKAWHGVEVFDMFVRYSFLITTVKGLSKIGLVYKVIAKYLSFN